MVILAAERTELLLRIENFTTLRQRAFKEAFDAVNQNFQSIFAISEGDGYNSITRRPFNSGLNLVAPPQRQTRAGLLYVWKNLSPLSAALSCPATLPPLLSMPLMKLICFLDGESRAC